MVQKEVRLAQQDEDRNGEERDNDRQPAVPDGGVGRLPGSLHVRGGGDWILRVNGRNHAVQ